jgi:alanine racemase
MKINQTQEYDNPIRAFIDLNAFKNNIGIVRKKYPGSRIILPVKANAYGHDAVLISKEAEKTGIEYLAVARINEALELRNNGIKLPIIDLGVELKPNIKIALNNKVELSVSSIENLHDIDMEAAGLNTFARIHLKINTGMTRLGFNTEDIPMIIDYLKKSGNLKLTSVYSHFPRSEDDFDFTNKQIGLFMNIRDHFEKSGLRPEFYHIFNSGAILDSYAHEIDFAVRPGIMIYGYSPYNDDNSELVPVLTLKSKVIHVMNVPENTGVSYNHTYVTNKPSVLATIPAGYGDGFHRILSNKFSVTINGKNYPQRGTITMDLMVIEVDDSVKIGDDVILFGNKSDCCNDAKDLADLAGTISYEITSSLTKRVERIISN